MGIHKYKPTTHSLRFTEIADFAELTKSKPEKSLLAPLRKRGGRNSGGRVTCRHHGGGHKRMYRLIDFARNRLDAPAKVLAVEYDPNRSSRLALIQYADGAKAYILFPLDLKIGATVISSFNGDTEIAPGNCLPLKYVPLGAAIHNIELVKGKGGQIVRSAGTSAQVTAKEGDFAHVRLPSGEVRLIHVDCRATIGQLGNVEHEAIVLGKAGRNRWLGRRPNVRGSAMNPHDHPHGGGEGKAGQGNPHPTTPWGKPTKGYKTRKPGKYSDRYIIKRRK